MPHEKKQEKNTADRYFTRRNRIGGASVRFPLKTSKNEAERNKPVHATRSTYFAQRNIVAERMVRPGAER
jgi:hypothetical protein